MNNKGKLFPIALVLTILILASSTALAATQPAVGSDYTPAVGSDYTPAVGSDYTFVKPIAAFDAKQTSQTAPFNVSFTDNSTGTIFMWNWDFGDGNTSTDQNATHAYATEGNYNVTLQVIGAGSDKITKLISVVVSKAPVAAFSTCISGRSVKFTDESTGSPTCWSWNFGDKCTSTARNPTHKYSKAGKYTVTLTAENAAGCNKKTSYITVK